MKNLVWFRNDLRIHDNPSLLETEKNGFPTLFVYVLDETQKQVHELGFPKQGNFRERFLLESLVDLHNSLQKLNAELLIFEGNPVEWLNIITEKEQISHVFYQTEIAWEEKQQEKQLSSIWKTKGIKVKRHFNSVLYDINKAPFDLERTPDVFTVFRKKMEAELEIEKPLPEPKRLSQAKYEHLVGTVSIEELLQRIETLPKPDSRTAFPFSGGESSGKKRVQQYFFEQDLLKDYKKTRNGFIGADYSSKLSPWLALGCLSPRWVAAEVARYEKERIKNNSTYWLIFELIWREYWRYAFIKHGNAYFLLEGISRETRTWKQDKTWFERWRLGQTGFPLVDANMRELLETGWMSNRGRQIVASFFAKNLELDWRWGAAWFESQLVDYDVYSNWGNWAYVAGVGNDGRDRYFNLITQAEKYDADGEFMKLWCPELNEINGATLRVLHQLSDSERMLYGLHGDVYPKPMIDLEKSYQKLNQKRR